MSSHDGQWVTVEAVTDLNEVATVYNLRVSDYHTYFVGGDDWGFSVWAHNSCFEIRSIGNGRFGLFNRTTGQPVLLNGTHVTEATVDAVRQAGLRISEVSTAGIAPGYVSEVLLSNGRTARLTIGGGGTTAHITPEQMQAIQRFADQNQVSVTVVGSRASGTASATSDFDYIIEGINSATRQRAMRDLPRGPRVVREFGQTNGIDIIRNTPLNPELPHVTFTPAPPPTVPPVAN